MKKLFIAITILSIPLAIALGAHSVSAQTTTTSINPTTTMAPVTTTPSVPSGAPMTGFGYGY